MKRKLRMPSAGFPASTAHITGLNLDGLPGDWGDRIINGAKEARAMGAEGPWQEVDCGQASEKVRVWFGEHFRYAGYFTIDDAGMLQMRYRLQVSDVTEPELRSFVDGLVGRVLAGAAVKEKLAKKAADRAARRKK